jgi:ankyrin repeat protein
MFFPDKAVKTDEESQRPSPPAESKPIEPVAEVPSQQSAPSPESKPVAEASQPEPPSEADRALFKAAAGVELGDTSVRFSGESEAGNIEAVKQHLAAGADVDVKGGWRGGTPLYYAVGEGRNEIAKLLIAKGADVNVKGKFGGTPLHLATTKEIAGLLIAEGADVNAKDERGKTPLDLAIQVRNTKTADLLRKHGGKTGDELKAADKPTVPVAEAAQLEPPTAKAPDISIHDAAKKGNIEAVKQHIAAGTDVNAKDYRGWTPLYFAASRGHKEIAELLVDKGADVNAKSDGDWTPLFTAALNGHKEIAELLIAKGANVNAIEAQGKTPLGWATHPDNPNDTAETADLLRKHGGKTSEELKAEGK